MLWLWQQLKKMQRKANRSIQRHTEEVKKLRRLLKGLEVVGSAPLVSLHSECVYRKVLENHVSVCQAEARQTEDDCESTIVCVIDSLQRGFESLRRTIRAQQQEAAAGGQRCLKGLQANLRKVKRRKAELQRLAVMDDNAAFLKVDGCS